ncbi:MAG TPA: ParB/RepB/Spo0J family partition protein [Syntrophobacteria bacterium]|nr:ParB/RepB/Spo0J family partition protein [Syntrophobacteria bacterium]
MAEPHLEPIPFAAIDWQDTSSLITYGPLPDILRRSVQAVGLLQIPMLQGKPEGGFRVVSGSRRLLVCRELGLEPVTCQILDASVLPGACLRFAVYDNVATRLLNPVEKSLVLAKMLAFLPQPQVVEEFMPLLALEPSVTLLSRYLELLRLEKDMLDALADGRLHERTASALAPLEPADRRSLFALFGEFAFSVSVQQEIIELAVEIGEREGMPPAEVLEADAIAALRRERRRPTRHRAEEIRRYLQGRRAPRLTARRERFLRETQELGLPSGVRLISPPNFEGPQWRLECIFQRGQDLAHILRTVSGIAAQPEFQRVLEGCPISSP